jgi:hypothetical protein
VNSRCRFSSLFSSLLFSFSSLSLLTPATFTPAPRVTRNARCRVRLAPLLRILPKQVLRIFTSYITLPGGSTFQRLCPRLLLPTFDIAQLLLNLSSIRPFKLTPVYPSRLLFVSTLFCSVYLLPSDSLCRPSPTPTPTRPRIVINPRWSGHQNIAAPPRHLAPAPVHLRSNGDANRHTPNRPAVPSASCSLFLGFCASRSGFDDPILEPACFIYLSRLAPSACAFAAIVQHTHPLDLGFDQI